MSIVDETDLGIATVQALKKFGSIVVDDDEVWPAFVEEVGWDDHAVNQALHALRFRGYAAISIVPHPNPRGRYVTITRRYDATQKELSPKIQPRIIADDDPTEKQVAARERAKTG